MFVKQKCNSSSTVQQTRILSSNVFSRKEKRGLSSSPGLKSTKYIYRNNPFQNGKSRHAKISHKPWRLHDKHRLDRRLSVCPNSSEISKIPSIYLAKQSLPIQSDALRTKCSSQGIHEAIKTGRSLASRPGNPSHHILRRHSDNGFLCGISKTTQTNNYLPSGIIRVPDKLRQVNVNPNSKDSIPGVVDRFDTNVVHSARNKNHVNSQSMSACQQTTTNYSRSLTGSRPTRILPTGSVVSTVTLSSASRTSNKFTETVVRLRPTNTSDTPSQGGLIMVDKQSTLVERQSNTTSNCRYYDNIRCFQNGLGCFHGNPDDRRQVVAGGSTGTHQYPRTQSGIFCSQVVLERQNKPSDLLKIGQHYGGSVLEQHGGHTLSSASSTDSRDLGMVRKEKRISSRPTYSRSKQYGSRCRVPSYEGLERLEAEVRCDPPINNRMPNRPICITPVPPARQICQLETGPQRIIHGCLYNQLEQHDSVCLSSVQSHPCSPAQSESRECDPGVSSSTLVGPTVVASVDRNVDRLPSVLGKQQGTPDGHVESGSIPPTIPHAQVSRVENIRGQFASTGLSNTAVELLSNSVKASTAKSYNCSWTIWSRWCDKRQSNPIFCPINEILIFLAEKYSEGKEYRTINVFRSAISSTHIHIDNKPVGQHPLVIRLMKGISISRPPQPRYHTTWDVKTVTEFLSNLGDNSSLSLKQLSQKLCILMALSCPERSSIMATLDVRYMRRYPEGIKFLHTTYRKPSHNGTLGESIYPKFSQCSRLCPVECLSTYLEKTKQWRPFSDSMQQLLFLALKKPHRPVSSATLSRWLKEVIHLAGIKEDIFKGHSVRGASTSAAKRAGLSIGTILSMADWTNTSTFNKFYYKPSLPVLFGTTVLSTS